VPTFSYRAVSATGRTLQGAEEALSASELEHALGARGLLTLEVRPGAATPTQAKRGFRARRADVAEAVRYLAVLTGSGFPLDRALETVAAVVVRPDVRDALEDVRTRVRSGGTLADSMEERSRVFPRLAVAMARAGERGGHLPEALERLAAHLEQEERLRGQLLSAVLYPAVMALVGGAALFVLVLYVLPRFAAMLGDAGAALPRSTALVLGTGDFVSHSWPAILLAALAVIGAVVWYRRSSAGRVVSDRLLLRMPVIGGLRRQIVAARLGRTLAVLLRGGLPILPSLQVAADALTDRAAAGDVLRAREEVRGGERLAPALGRGQAFSYVFLQMLDLGEQGGRLPEMLERGAATAEQDLERGLERLVRLVEPTLIVVFGAIVGFVALSLLQAIYGVNLVR